MFEYIEKLRGKPEATKKRIAFFGALVFSFFILVIWLSVVVPKVKNPEVVKEKPTTPSPLSAIGDNISDGFSSIKEAFSGVKDSVESIGLEMEQYQNIATSTEYVATTTINSQ